MSDQTRKNCLQKEQRTGGGVMSSAEERGYKDTDTFEMFKKDLDKVLEKHYPDTDYQWDYLDDHWVELTLWIREPIEETSDE